MAQHVYHWKHGWIPLDHAAALSKAKGNRDLAATYLRDAHSPGAGINSRQDVAKALRGIPSVGDAGERRAAMEHTAVAARMHGATDLLPGHAAAVAHGVSEPFTSHSQLSQAWDKVRGDILEKHGHPRDLKNARLANGNIVMDMKHGDRWVPYTSDSQTAMRDTLRMHHKAATGTQFRLRASYVPKHA